MKKSAEIMLCMCVPMMIFLSGCLEINVRTAISGDGSSERTISMKLPSQDVPDNAFPVPLDSTWTIEWKEIGEKDAKYEYVARKKFATPDALHREYAAFPDTNTIGINVTVNKRFEWFFTYVEYDEEYTFRNTLANVPISDYLTKDEIERYVRGEKDDIVKKKVQRWEARNFFEEFYRPLVAEAKRRNDDRQLVSLLEAKREECFNRFAAADSDKSKDAKHLEDPKKDNVDDVEGALRLLANVLGTDAVFTLRPVAETAWNTMFAKFNTMKHPDGWQSSVQMPGMILETNSDKLEGNTITWKFNADQIRVGNYLMHASSRVTNVWAFVVTGVVALLVVVLGLRRSFRSRM